MVFFSRWLAFWLAFIVGVIARAYIGDIAIVVFFAVLVVGIAVVEVFFKRRLRIIDIKRRFSFEASKVSVFDTRCSMPGCWCHERLDEYGCHG